MNSVHQTKFCLYKIVVYFLLLVPAGAATAQAKPGAAANRAPVSEKLINPGAVNNFYLLLKSKTFWLTNNASSVELRQQLAVLIDSCGGYGLNSYSYHQQFIKQNISLLKTDSNTFAKADRVFTDAAITLFRDIYTGNISGFLGYDEISAKYTASNNNFLLGNLLSIKNGNSLGQFAASLEPQSPDYALIKAALQDARKNNAVAEVKKLASAVNYMRWINHFHFAKYILVNIAADTLLYFEGGNVVLGMKVVVGKPSTRTPRFAAYCDQVVLYPYWNVPRSIALNELLPQFKRNPSALDAQHMQVIDGNGRVVNYHNIAWAAYDKGNFPYSFRQCTGCDNSLGVIKFNLSDPFNVYMHDTNNKRAFLSNSRYLSHGCIRLEKPLDLGTRLLNNKLDTSFLQKCLKNEEPTFLPLDAPVPVLAIYLIATPAPGNTVALHKDVYRLFN